MSQLAFDFVVAATNEPTPGKPGRCGEVPVRPVPVAAAAPTPTASMPAAEPMGGGTQTRSAIVRAADEIGATQKNLAIALTDALAVQLGEPIRLVVNDNRRTMVSASRRKDGRLEVRLHRMFLAAPAPTIADLSRYLRRGDRAAGQRLDAYIAQHRDRITAPKRRTRIRTQGEHHDLGALYWQLEATYFPSQLGGVRVTWGKRSGRRKQRSIRLGTYSMSTKLIRVHPVLDQAWVPEGYVKSVLHHEMLHHVMPPERVGGQLRYHTPAFRRREREFEGFEQASAWEKAHLDRLLREA